MRRTAYDYCPCGQAVPCPDHGNFPGSFFEASPWSADIADAMHQRGLPYTWIKTEELEVAEPSQTEEAA
jgi:hypothetical protein